MSANHGKMTTMFLARPKAVIIHSRSFYKGWLIVCLWAALTSYTTATLAEPGNEAAEQDDYSASTQYLSTADIEELTLDDSTEPFGRTLTGSVPARPTIHLATPENAPIQDISIRILRKAYDKLGYHLVVHKLPNLRSLKSANNGEYDGEVSRIANLSSIYPNLHAVPTAINAINIVALGQLDSAIIQRIEDIRDDPLCVRGIIIVERLASANHIECHFVVNIIQALTMVSLGRAKYTLLPETNARISHLHLPVSNVQIVSPVLHSEALYHYLHEKNLNLVEPLDKILSEMRSSGEIDQILSNYFDSKPGQADIGLDDHNKY